MAYIKISHAHSGFGKAAINYCLNGKAHNHNKYVHKRVLAATGINCTVGGCRQQMAAAWKRFHVDHPSHRRQIQRLIVSFDPGQLNYKRPRDVKTAQSIGTELANKLYPTRQSIIVTQADGQGHKLHDHILTNMIDPITGKSMTSRQTSWRPITKVADHIIKARGLDPMRHKYIKNGKPVSPNHETDAEYHLKAQGKYSWVADLRERLHGLAFNSTSCNWSEFIKNGREHGIKIGPYRKRKGKPRLDKNGHPMFKKHITFIFTDRTGKQHKIRDRRLGENFSKAALNKVFAYVADEADQVRALKQAKAFELKQKREAKKKARLLKQAEARRKKLELQNEILEAKHQRAIKQAKDDQHQRVQAQAKFESNLKRQKAGFLAKCKRFISSYFSKFLYICELGKFYWQLIKAGKASAPSDQILTKMKQKAQDRKSKLLSLFYKNQNGPEL